MEEFIAPHKTSFLWLSPRTTNDSSQAESRALERVRPVSHPGRRPALLCGRAAFPILSGAGSAAVLSLLPFLPAGPACPAPWALVELVRSGVGEMVWRRACRLLGCRLRRTLWREAWGAEVCPQRPREEAGTALSSASSVHWLYECCWVSGVPGPAVGSGDIYQPESLALVTGATRL